MEPSIIFGVLTIVNILFTTWLALRRTKSQNILDDSAASVNYRKMVIDMQADMRKQEEEIKELKAVIERAHLYIELGIQVDNAPIIKKWEWKKVEIKTPE